MAFKMRGHGLKGPNQRANTDGAPTNMNYKEPMKMVDRSPLDRALVGDQKNLPDHLKEKIEAAPTKMTDGSPIKYVGLIGGVYRGTKLLNNLRKANKAIKATKKSQKLISTTKKTNKSIDFTKRSYDLIGDGLLPGPKKGILKRGLNWAKNNKMKIAKGVTGLVVGDYLANKAIDYFSKDSKKDKKSATTTPKKGTPKVTLDTKVKGGNKTWRQGMKSSGGGLNDLAKKRDTLKKGSDEYNSVQNKINVHLGSKKRHGVTSSTGTKGRKTTTTENVPGVSSSKSVTKKRTIGGTKIVANKSNLMNNTSSTTKTKGKGFGDGKKIKTTSFGSSGNKTTKVKEKYNRNKVTGAGETGDHYTGRRKKRKVTTYNDDGTITKTKMNDRTGKVKVKTRKKGGTGLFNRNKKFNIN